MRRSPFRIFIILPVTLIALGVLICFIYPGLHHITLNHALFDAIERNDVIQARRLLAHGANPNTSARIENNSISATLPVLCIATYAGNRSNVEALIADGADINARGQRGETPLMIASSSGRIDIVEELIKRGADVEDKDGIGWTALRYALWQGHINVVEVLLAHGADVNTKDNSEYTPLKFVERNLHDKALAKRLDLANALVLLKKAGAKE